MDLILTLKRPWPFIYKTKSFVRAGLSQDHQKFYDPGERSNVYCNLMIVLSGIILHLFTSNLDLYILKDSEHKLV